MPKQQGLVQVTKVLDLDEVIKKLADMRNAWQKEANERGVSLSEIQVGLGWILLDFTEMLCLNEVETTQVLGRKLKRELDQTRNSPVGVPVQIPMEG